MSYGILVNNASGFTQIDGTYDNISSFSSGTVARSYTTSSGSQVLNKVTFPSNTPTDYLIFAKPSAQTNLRQITLAVYSDGFAFFAPWQASDNFNIDYFIGVRSRDMPTNTSPDHGLNVYKANGEQAYSSNNSNLRVSAVSFDDLSSTSTTPASFTVGSMSGIYTLMSGKNYVGRSPQGYPNFSVIYSFFQEFNFTAKTITGKITPVTNAAPSPSGSFGGGFKTNLIGILT
jgi:hypothetical protein